MVAPIAAIRPKALAPSRASYLSASVVSVAVGIFGLKKLVAGYAGNCVELVRGDGTTASFGFAGDNIDSASIIAWNALNSGGAANLRVSKWYDQSGNGNDLVQSTADRRPALELSATFQQASGAKATLPAEGVPALYFNESIATAVGSAYLSCPSGAVNNQNFSCITCSKYNDQYYSQQNTGSGGPEFQLGGSGGIFSTETFFRRQNVSSPVQAMSTAIEFNVNGSFKDLPFTKSWRAPNQSYAVRSIRNAGVGTFARWGNWQSDSVSGGNSGTGTGFQIGRSNGTSITSAQIITAFILTTALGTTDEQAAMDTLASAWSTSNAPTVLLAVDGDSISSGYPGNTFDVRNFSWFRSVSQSIISAKGGKVVCHNLAQPGGWIGNYSSPWGALSGQTAGTQAVQQAPQAPDSLDPLLQGTTFTKKVLIVWMGRNDITLFGSGGSPGFGATIHGQLNAYCTARRAAGWYVIVCDAIPGADMTAGQMAAELTSFNSLIAANWSSYADAFVQLSARDWKTGTPSTYYQENPTYVHPNAAGQALAAAAILPYVQAAVA